MAEVIPSTGNVFEDLGFSPDEAANLKVRSALMVEIVRIIEERKLTQVAAAELFGVSQPRISDVVRGKINLFSIDGLIAMLARSGADVIVRVAEHPRAA